MQKNFREAQLFSDKDLEDRVHYHSLRKIGITGKGITVAILDTGINKIEELRHVITKEKDFTGDNNPQDGKHIHGTEIARAVHRVAPDSKIANYKVFSEREKPNRKTVCDAIRQCINDYPEIRVINLSMEFSPEGCSSYKVNSKSRTFCSLCSIVNEAVQKGIFVTAAAGNRGPKSGTLTCPGLAEEALTATASISNKEIQWWNNLSWFKRWWYKFSGQYGKIYGTSFSAAWDSGLIALLLSAFPEFHSFDIKEAINVSVDENWKIHPNKNNVRFPNIEIAYEYLMRRKKLRPEPVQKTPSIFPTKYNGAKDAVFLFLLSKNVHFVLTTPLGGYYNPSLFQRDFQIITNYIWYLMKMKNYKTALMELIELKDRLSSSDYPHQYEKILHMISECKNELKPEDMKDSD